MAGAGGCAEPGIWCLTGWSATTTLASAINAGAMRDVGWYHRGGPGVQRVLGPVDHKRDGPLDHVPHLFLLVVVLVDRHRVGAGLVVRECHVLGVKEAPLPARQGLGLDHVPRFDQAHAAQSMALGLGAPWSRFCSLT